VPTGGPDRETRITRSACLNMACTIRGSHGPIELGAVLALAEEVEAWVLR
jgi:hypothetical protein